MPFYKLTRHPYHLHAVYGKALSNQSNVPDAQEAASCASVLTVRCGYIRAAEKSNPSIFISAREALKTKS